MECHWDKRGWQFKDDGTLKEKIPSTVKTPKSRGIGYISEASTPSSMCFAAAAMPSSEVAVTKDVVTGSLKENCTWIVHSCNHCQCKKDKASTDTFITSVTFPNLASLSGILQIL